VTGVGVLIVFAVTENAVDVAPCGTVTVDGTLTSAGEELMLTIAPPLPATEVKATVQVDPVDGVIDTGLHVNPFSAGVFAMVTVPPLAEAEIGAAEGFAAVGVKIWTGDEVFVVEVETFRETVATTPLGIAPELSAHRTHLILPVCFSQETDLLA
jgi:hypothetical protein